MARALHANLIATLGGDIKPFYAVDFHFDSGTLYLWTGVGDRVILGNTYLGAGDFLSISSMAESLETAAIGLKLALSGVPPAMISLALSEPIRNRKCTIYYGDLGVAEVSIVYEGIMNQMPIDEGADSTTISLSVEHELITLEQITRRLFTSSSQKSRYPNDLGFDFVNDLQDINWKVS